MSVKILLVEDHPIFRVGARRLVEAHWPDATVAESGTLHDALEIVRRERWSAAVVDLNLPDANGLDALSALRAVDARLRVLVLSLNAEAAYAERVLQLGGAGYLTKDRASEELIAAIERILAGHRYIGPRFAERLAERVVDGAPTLPHEALSSREYQVMLRLATGDRVSDIAADMHLSPKTISTYRGRILQKLGVDGNVDLARYCLAYGLIR